MSDVFSREKRSWIMARISGRDTKPEIIVRKIVYGLGYRYRLNVRKLPGAPDIVLAKHKKVIFVHGCFWHGHKNCVRAKRPQTHTAFWNKKIDSNIKRDIESIKLLRKAGWKIFVIWSCQTNKPDRLAGRISQFLRHSNGPKQK